MSTVEEHEHHWIQNVKVNVLVDEWFCGICFTRRIDVRSTAEVLRLAQEGRLEGTWGSTDDPDVMVRVR